MRTLQYFDLRDIDQFLIERRRIDLLYAVDDHRNRWLAVTRLRDAANDDESVARILGFNQIDVRCQVNEVEWTFDPGILDGFGVERGDGGGNILQILVAAKRADHDFLRVFSNIGCFLRVDNSGGERGAAQ